MVMAIQDLTVKIISPEDARCYLQEYEYARQRNISHHVVKYYADMMRNGEWLPGSEIEIAYAPNDDGKVAGYLVNGQQRLHAVIEADKSIPFVIKEVLCSDMDEVNIRYGLIDTGRGRNNADYVRAMGMEEELGFTQRQIGNIGAASIFIASDFFHRNKYKFTPAERVELIKGYAPAAHNYFDCVRSGPLTHAVAMYRTGTMSVGLVSFDESAKVWGHDRVADFWTGIAKNDGLRVGDPRKLVVEHLRESSINSRLSKKKYDVHHSARFVAQCFNAWLEARQITRTFVKDDGKGPIIVKGSKFRGK